MLSRRNAVQILMSVELMLNAVAVNFVAFAAYTRTRSTFQRNGIFAVFVIIIAAAEVGLALAYHPATSSATTQTVNVDEVSDRLKW